MRFLLQAFFYLAVVSVFVPNDFAGEAELMPEIGTEAALDAEQALNGWCDERPAVCEAGEEAAELTGFLVDFAAARIESAIAERDEPRRRQVAALD